MIAGGAKLRESDTAKGLDGARASKLLKFPELMNKYIVSCKTHRVTPHGPAPTEGETEGGKETGREREGEGGREGGKGGWRERGEREVGLSSRNITPPPKHPLPYPNHKPSIAGGAKQRESDTAKGLDGTATLAGGWPDKLRGKAFLMFQPRGGKMQKVLPRS